LLSKFNALLPYVDEKYLKEKQTTKTKQLKNGNERTNLRTKEQIKPLNLVRWSIAVRGIWLATLATGLNKFHFLSSAFMMP